MFKGKIVGRRVSRLASIVVVGSLTLTLVATPASAQSLAGTGAIGASVSCNMSTRTATVNVNVGSLGAYDATGLYFYVELWAKARSKAWGTTPIATAQTPSAIKTRLTGAGAEALAGFGTLVTWRTATIMSTSFRSTLAYTDAFDIFIRYWYAPPGATRWTGYFQFNVSGDPHSSISQVSSAGSPFVSYCTL